MMRSMRAFVKLINADAGTSLGGGVMLTGPTKKGTEMRRNNKALVVPPALGIGVF